MDEVLARADAAVDAAIFSTPPYGYRERGRFGIHGRAIS